MEQMAQTQKVIGGTVDISGNSGGIAIQSQKHQRYCLEELLRQCDATAQMSDEDREWLGASPVGRERDDWKEVDAG
jgi:antitoxin ChpS